MCLIITGKSSSIRSTLLNTHGMLADIFTSNPDGIGIMYGTAKGLKVIKTLPKSLADATAFIQRLPVDERELAIHFRWTTHGNTDMTNCHPYDVIPGYVSMMHNGVLHTGNKADTTKSDTWHFIKDFIASPVTEHPPLIHNQSYLDMLAECIGDNRFVFMDGDGNMSHVNYDQGIEHEGLWFSNTYAWSPAKLIPNYYKASVYSKRYSMYNEDYEDYVDYNNSWAFKTPSTTKASVSAIATSTKPVSAHNYNWMDEDYDVPETFDGFDPEAQIALIEKALGEYNATLMMDLLDTDPEGTLELLFDVFEPSYVSSDELSSSTEEDIVQMILSQDVGALLELAHDHRVSSVLCYYFAWDKRESMYPAD